jgi:hypothetical protein
MLTANASYVAKYFYQDCCMQCSIVLLLPTVMMWKRIIAFLFLAAFATQTFNKAIIITGFFANRTYIAQNLCVNKDKPKLGCNGKCHLKKQLSNEEKKDQQNPDRKGDNKDEVLSSKSFFGAITFTYSIISHQHYIQSDNSTVQRSRTFFHPPAWA